MNVGKYLNPLLVTVTTWNESQIDVSSCSKRPENDPRSRIIGNIRKVLIEETSETDFKLPLVTLSPCVFSPLGLLSVSGPSVLCLWCCDRSWTLTVKSGNKITVSCNFSSNLQMQQRIPTILLPVIVLCKVVLCQIRFTSYNFVLSFKACVVHHITFLSDSQLHSWTYFAIYWHPQTFSSQDAAAWSIMKEVICRKIIRDNNGR